MWLHFLQHWNSKSSFMEDHYTDAPDLSLYTDALGAHGYGHTFRGSGFEGTGPQPETYN